MIALYDAASGAHIGNVTEAQFQQLVDALEEESAEDRDYYVNRATVELLRERHAEPGLLEALETGLAGREDMDVRWERV
jgi:hypothetical protein